MASIRDRDACREPANLLAQGFPVSAYVRCVCVLWVDGDSEGALDDLYRIKGAARAGHPVGPPPFEHTPEAS